jgi:amino acid transporter
MMSIAAMLATASSVNANLYGAGNMTKAMSEQGAFPPVFAGPSRVGGTRGLMITVILSLILANLFDLSAIASLGSAVALSIFLILSIAAYRLRKRTGSNVAIIAAGALSTAVVLAVFSADLLSNEPRTLVVFGVFVVLAFALELLWSRSRDRTARLV